MKTSGSITILILVSVSFISCSSQPQEKRFFDIPEYFKSEIKSIQKDFATVTKTSVYNGDTSTQEFKTIDVNWERELGVFLQADINKPVYYTHLKTTGWPIDGPGSTSYWADSPKLPIQKIVLVSNGDKTTQINLKMVTKNLVSSQMIDATYIKSQCYIISGEQQVNGLETKNTFYVKGFFSK